MKVSTDPAKIETLLTRHVMEIVVEKNLRQRLASGKRLRVKLGVDPTTPDLHLGHAVALKKLREFQELGHQVVLIIGDYTTRVGDPTGKSKTRPMLLPEQIEANAQTYLDQAGKILDLKKIELRRNGEWFAKLDFNGVIQLAAKFTVARMIERDDFAKRLKQGTDIHLHEIMYPMMQAYDSIMVEADVEIGGTDQKFNILAGRDLQRKLNKPEQDCLFLGPTLVGTDGVNKMSKSLGNYVGVSDPPEQMFGKTMSIPDDVMWDWFRLTTDLPAEEIDLMRSACSDGQMNPREAKARLAREIITLYYSAADAAKAEAAFVKVFQNKEAPDDVRVSQVKPGRYKLNELLLQLGLTTSKSESRRVITQGGLRIAGQMINDPMIEIELSREPDSIKIYQRDRLLATHPAVITLQKGKRHFVNLKVG